MAVRKQFARQLGSKAPPIPDLPEENKKLKRNPNNINKWWKESTTYPTYLCRESKVKGAGRAKEFQEDRDNLAVETVLYVYIHINVVRFHY